MTDVAFRIDHAAAVAHAATPELALTIEISMPGTRVDSVLLRSTVRIEAGQRTHDEAERDRLRELFGGDSVWSRSPKSLLWAQTTSLVPGFESMASADVILPCSYDLAAAAFRYLHGLRGGDVPLTVQFSGTLFTRVNDALRVTPIPWDREATFSMPVALFESVIDAHFPGEAVLGLGREVFERLDRYRRDNGIRSLDEAIDGLLVRAGGKRVA